MLFRRYRLQSIALSLCLVSAMGFNSTAMAVPGLASSDSVKKIVDMIKVYAKRNQRVNAYDIEKKLRDRPRAASEALVDLLDTTDVNVQYQSANVLRRLSSNNDYSISNDALKTLIAILRTTESPKVKATLVGVLGNIGPKNDSVKKAILEVIDGDFEVTTKRSAIEALANLARQEKPAYHIKSTKVLVRILEKNDAPALRKAAASALSRYHNDADLAVPALVGALDDNYLKVRVAAVRALGYYKAEAEQAIPKLLKMVSEESDSGIRSACIYTLKNIGKNDQRVVAKFIELIDDPQLVSNVLNYIYNFGDKAAPAIPKLVKLLDSPDRYKRQYACRALGAIGSLAKKALPSLKKAAKDSDSTVRRYATSAINSINNVSRGRS